MRKYLTSLAVGAMCLVGCTSANRLAYESKTPPTPITSSNFDQLWDASLESLREFHFEIDRQDRRAGVITTKPMTSSQFFEPWRNELKTADAVAESSLATTRRTVTVSIDKTGTNFSAMPSVRVERFSRRERRMTTSAQYTSAFRATEARGSIEADQGINLPSQYWYDIGKDPALATSVSQGISKRLR
ncbi:MAG TPA: hypothetical protein PK402_07525 [Tepidisphaeraceae bacterium]|nr:hypothetical protein [Tepidisphaeraceae bacterium]